MPDRTESSILIEAAPGAVLDVIADFEAYPKWATEVKAATVLSEEGDGWPDQVEFVVDAGAIKDTYVLDYEWDVDEAGTGVVSWGLVKASILKAMNGSYTLATKGSATDVTYRLAVDLTIPMLGMLRRKAEKVIVDTALRELKKRVEGLTPVRIVLFTGKGGVGKTTTAAACAVRAARSGVRTLVVSTDAAHSLGDTLCVDLAAARGEPVAVEPGLHALEVGAPRRVDGSWRVVQDYLLDVLGSLGIDPLVAEELSSLPGADEVAALLALQARAESGEWDLLVVDCAPTAETLRLLALPEALAWHLQRLLPAQRGLLRGLRPAAAAAAGVPLPSPAVTTALTGWYRRLRAVHALLTGPAASVRLVLTPERVVVAEARRTWTSLGLYGFAVDGVVVNRVLPPSVGRADAWRRSWNAAQQAGLADVADSFAELLVARLPYLAEEPIGADALDGLAAAVDSSSAAAPGDPFGVLGPVRPRGPRVRRSGSGYVLALPLPLVSAADVDLKRRGGELLVEVGDHRRVLGLPSVLQRCVVRGAQVSDGRLTVRFEPDPALWPAAPADAGDAEDAEDAEDAGTRPDRRRLVPEGTGGASVGSVAEETARLLDALLGTLPASEPTARPTARSTARPTARPTDSPADSPTAPPTDSPVPGAPVEPAPRPAPSHTDVCDACGREPAAVEVCHLCPVCQLLRVVRAVRPETLDRLADLAAAVTDTLRDTAAARWRETAGAASHTAGPVVEDIPVTDDRDPARDRR